VDGAEAYTKIASMNQDELIEKYATLVKRIAHHLIGRLPDSVLVDDLIQSGMIGLLGAAQTYNADKGASFETYAGIRIRGAMLDEVRKNDWVPRSVYRNSRKITEAVRHLENELGRTAKDSEIAELLDMSLEQYHQILRDASTCQVFGYEDVGLTDDNMDFGITDESLEPLQRLQREDFYKLFCDSINSLPERERLVLALYYDEEMNLKEIGAILDVSESRVCQIHSQAIHRLKARMPEWRALDASKQKRGGKAS